MTITFLDLHNKRKQFYDTIIAEVRAFCEETKLDVVDAADREKSDAQRTCEAYYGGLFVRLAALFSEQKADWGEFKPIEWKQAKAQR